MRITDSVRMDVVAHTFGGWAIYWINNRSIYHLRKWSRIAAYLGVLRCPFCCSLVLSFSSADLSVRVQKSSMVFRGGKYFIASVDLSEIEDSPTLLLSFYVAASAVGTPGCREAFCCCQRSRFLKQHTWLETSQLIPSSGLLVTDWKWNNMKKSLGQQSPSDLRAWWHVISLVLPTATMAQGIIKLESGLVLEGTWKITYFHPSAVGRDTFR